MAGCRSCYHKDEDTVYGTSGTSWKQCFVKNRRVQCGANAEVLDKLQELQTSNPNLHEDWRLDINVTSSNVTLVKGECKDDDPCCFKNTNDANIDETFSEIGISDKKIFANIYHSRYLGMFIDPQYAQGFFQYYDRNIYDDDGNITGVVGIYNGSFSDYYVSYALYGNKGVSYCKKIFNIDGVDQIENDLFYKNIGYTAQYLNWKLNSSFINQNGWQGYFDSVPHVIKVTHNESSNKLEYNYGFTFNDGCGIAFVPMNPSIYPSIKTHSLINLPKFDPSSIAISNAETCGNDVCNVHLQYLKYISSIYDFKTWKNATYHDLSGKKVGGETCRVLRIYGFISLLAPCIHLLFNIMHYRKDFAEGHSDYFDIIPLLCFLYPQWKSIKILLAYFEHQNEEELQKDKEKFDRNLGTLEPFLESAVQVSS